MVIFCVSDDVSKFSHVANELLWVTETDFEKKANHILGIFPVHRIKMAKTAMPRAAQVLRSSHLCNMARTESQKKLEGKGYLFHLNSDMRLK